jgi:hypothetical membrane protein
MVYEQSSFVPGLLRGLYGALLFRIHSQSTFSIACEPKALVCCHSNEFARHVAVSALLFVFSFLYLHPAFLEFSQTTTFLDDGLTPRSVLSTIGNNSQ